MTAYYNENEPYAAQWLRNLIAAGHIADGYVDTRSIEEVTAHDLDGFTQCHFFAGIGGWSLALRLAGWADSRRIWTGSCPCQPFSGAGRGMGKSDPRHLWPAWSRLIAECRPAVVFGEQVSAATRHGWLDLVFDDLETAGYACGAVDIPALMVGAPHGRSRVWFVAERLADADTTGRSLEWGRELLDAQRTPQRHDADGRCAGGGLADAGCAGLEGLPRHGDNGGESGWEHAQPPGPAAPCGDPGHWASADWIPCRDGRARPVEPGTFPLAHGAASRLVYTCAVCNTETVSYEKLRTVRNFPSGYEGLRAQAVLLNEMLRSVDNCDSDHARERALSSAIPICRDLVQSLRGEHKTGASPQRREPDEQFAGKRRDSLPKVPRRSSPPFRPANADLQSVRKGVRSAPEEEFNMFCPVCAGVGAHQRTEEVGGSRVGRLRAYGNALVAPVAQAFIEAVMDGLGVAQ